MITDQNATQVNNAKTSTRPPVVVVLGHVDHGKSSLLEAIRKDFHITSKESGGITQHIGAYVVEHGGKNITFIDTPGHEAFSATRSRGAKVADIAVLVVAADEGVKPQTKEAIQQAEDAGIPLVVALHKVDKPGVQTEKVKQQLAEVGIYLESFGGKVPQVETSAVSKKGITELLDMILLMAELEDLKIDLSKPAEGVVIEAFMDPKRGSAATLLVQEGTLKAGDVAGTSSSFGKARILEDFQGESIEQALPSTPCLVIGFQETPQVGEKFQVFDNEEAAALFVTSPSSRILSKSVVEGLPTLDIVLKVDVLGSLEVVQNSLLAIPQEQVALRFVAAGVGEITENDVKTAIGTKARIIGFRTKMNAKAADLAQKEDLSVETFDVIYELVERIRALMEKNIEPETVKKELGVMKVLEVFMTNKNRQIVGGKVATGEIRKGGKISIFRNEEEVGQGKIVNLQKQKQDVGSVKAGEECGILYEGQEKVEVGDTLKTFVVESQQATL